MITDDYTYGFHFLDSHRVRAHEDGREAGEFDLAVSGLSLETLLALSWYVENTREQDCDDRLLLLLGRHLFNFMFAGAVAEHRDLLARLIDRCWNHTKPVRISLRFNHGAREYAQLPWEFLAIPRSGPGADDARHIVLRNGRITLTRHTEAQNRLRRATKLKVLVATYSAEDKAEINTSRLEGKLAEFRAEIGAADFDFEVLRDEDANWSGIEKALFCYQPDVFHFSGHGERNALWLANETRRDSFDDIFRARTPLGFGPLKGKHFNDFGASIDGVVKLFDRHQPQLVILDACSTEWTWLSEMLPGVAHQLVEVVPSVIAMRYPIDNGSAERFAVSLYTAIIEGRPLDEAVQGARYGLMPTGNECSHSHRAFGTPVLYLRDSERVCDALIRGDAPTTSSSQQPAPPQPCPRCHKDNVWVAKSHHCNRCKIVFVCRNKECARVYGKEEIEDLAGGTCPYCGEDYSDIPRWDGEQQLEPTAGQSRQAAQDSFGGLRVVH